MAKDHQVVAHVEAHVRKALEQLASKDGRTISSYLERLIVSHLMKLRASQPGQAGGRARKS
jgi:hypothetical protein